jgi:hypothetical protein
MWTYYHQSLIKLILCIFKQKNTHNLDTVIEYDNRCISNISYTNFLGITLDITLEWKTHVDQLLPKLSSACYTISFKTNYATRNISNGILWLFAIMNYGKGLKIYNSLPAYIKDISHNNKEFTLLFKKCSLFQIFLYARWVFQI